MTSAVPTRAATVPEWMASAPRSAPTVLSWMMLSVAGSAPERSSSACSWVCWVVKLPVMMPLPPQIALCTTGALMISLSSWMASRLPMLARVAAQKARPPAALKVKLMIGRPPCWFSKVALASSRSSPPTTTRLNTGRHCGW